MRSSATTSAISTNEGAFRGFVEAVGHFRRLFGLTPEVVAHDLHPGVSLHALRAVARRRGTGGRAASPRPHRQLPGRQRGGPAGHRRGMGRHGLRRRRQSGAASSSWRTCGVRARGHTSSRCRCRAATRRSASRGAWRPSFSARRTAGDGDARPGLRAPARSGGLARAEPRGRPRTERAVDLQRRPALRRRGQPARPPRPRRLRGAGGDGTRGAGRARADCRLPDGGGGWARRSSSGRPTSCVESWTTAARGAGGPDRRAGSTPRSSTSWRRCASASASGRASRAVALSGGVFQNAWLLKAGHRRPRARAGSRSTVIVRCRRTTAGWRSVKRRWLRDGWPREADA